MFTGIIEEIGIVKDFKQISNSAEITVSCNKVLNDTKIGDSIAINGVCQTVVEMSENSFTAEASNETLKVTNFSTLKKGEKVNLERALTLNERIGGHIVSGHVDSVAKLVSSKKNADFYDMNFDKTKRVTPWYVNFVTTYDENNNLVDQVNESRIDLIIKNVINEIKDKLYL